MSAPILSVILPAFEYRDGIRRILESISPSLPSSVEILIFDNSTSDYVKDEVSLWRNLNERIYYRKNFPSSNPADNWSDLIGCASGEYCLLLHHDEFPANSNFISDLINEIRRRPDIDVLILDCILVRKRANTARRHLPNSIRSWIIKNFPEYIFRRNVIGPTGCLVVRRKIYPRFDSRLRWLVDVDAYYRLRKATSRWSLSNSLQICSLQGRTDSITAGLGPRIPQILRDEQDYLVGKYPEAHRWLEPDSNRFLFAVEAICWYAMRCCTILAARAFAFFGINSVSSRTP